MGELGGMGRLGGMGGMGELGVSKDFSNKNKKNPSKDCSLEGL